MKQYRKVLGRGAIAVVMAVALFGLFPDRGSVYASDPVQELMPSQSTTLADAGGAAGITLGEPYDTTIVTTVPQGARISHPVHWMEEAWGVTTYTIANEGDEAGSLDWDIDLYCDNGPPFDSVVKQELDPDPGGNYEFRVRTTAFDATSGSDGTSEEFLYDAVTYELPIVQRMRLEIDNVKLGGVPDNAMLSPVPLNVPFQTLDYDSGTQPTVSHTIFGGAPHRPQFHCIDSPLISTVDYHGYANDTPADGALFTTPSGPAGLYVRWTTFNSAEDIRNGETSRVIDVSCFNISDTADPANDIENNWASWTGSGNTDDDRDCLPAQGTQGSGRPGDAQDGDNGSVCEDGTIAYKLYNTIPSEGGRDAAGAPATRHSDQDCDGLIDGVEAAYGTAMAFGINCGPPAGFAPLGVVSEFNGAEDSDCDGVPDYHEMFQFTDPNDPDTDGDGYLDRQFHMGHHDPVTNKTNETFEVCTASDVPITAQQSMDQVPPGGAHDSLWKRVGTCDLASIDTGTVAMNSDEPGANIWHNFDNCPQHPNTDQTNTDNAKVVFPSSAQDNTAADGDDLGDRCDTDDDNDGLLDVVEYHGYRIILISATPNFWRCNPLVNAAGVNQPGTAIGEDVVLADNSGLGYIIVPNASKVADIDGDGALDGVECILGAPGSFIDEFAGSDPTNMLSPLDTGCTVTVDWTSALTGGAAYRRSWGHSASFNDIDSGGVCKVSVPERCGTAISTWNAYLVGSPRDEDRDGTADEYCAGPSPERFDTDADGLADRWQEGFYRTQDIAVGPIDQDHNPDEDVSDNTGDTDRDSDNDSNNGLSPALLDGAEVIYLGTNPANIDTDSDDCADTIEALDLVGSAGAGRLNPRISGTDAGVIYAAAHNNRIVGVNNGYHPALDLNHDGRISGTDAGIVYGPTFNNKQCTNIAP